MCVMIVDLLPSINDLPSSPGVQLPRTPPPHQMSPETFKPLRPEYVIDW